MEFSRIGDHTVRCILTEDEIIDLGYSIDDILANADKTQEFMSHIFQMAERQFDMKFDMGLKTVRADFLPNHTVSLTFSENQVQQKVNGFMENLLNYINQLMGAQKAAAESKEPAKEVNDQPIIVLFAFDSMDVLCRFAKQVDIPVTMENQLYKYRDTYFVKLDLMGNTEEEVLRLSVVTDEYASGILVGSERFAFMKEHGELIIAEDAIATLRQL